MSLFFRFDLQAMLSLAQKPVSTLQIENFVFRDQLQVRQTA